MRQIDDDDDEEEEECGLHGLRRDSKTEAKSPKLQQHHSTHPSLPSKSRTYSKALKPPATYSYPHLMVVQSYQVISSPSFHGI